MEADRLSVGIAPLIFKLDSRWMEVDRLSALAILLPEKKPRLSMSCGLGVYWSMSKCFVE